MKDFENYLLDLKNLVSFNSVSEKKTKDAPFGKQNKMALNYFLKRATDFGFETINYDNYIGEIVFGSGEEVGIIGHLDVVPAGTVGWLTDPFTLIQKDGYLFGRGVSDDKGPTLLCLYALKELKDDKIIPKRKFRFFIGCNEEDGWGDIDYFNTKSTFPEYGFSPDGNFPLSYAEKGIYQIRFSIPKFKRFSCVKGGQAVNAVCAYASAKPTNLEVDTSALEKFNLRYTNGVIESFGKAAHGSEPHLGKNAIKPLLEYFKYNGEHVEDVIEYLFNDKKGLFDMKNEQGGVTLSPNIIEEDNEKVYLTCDCRIPAPLTISDVLSVIDTFKIDYTLLKHSLPPVCVQKDGWFVQSLLSAYNEVTGENAQPISMGGSTFARAFKKGCAFGMDFKRYENFIHDANERVKISDLQTAYEIYKRALFKLAQN